MLLKYSNILGGTRKRAGRSLIAFSGRICSQFPHLQVFAFLESELIRTGKGEHNLSEMYVVNHTYKDKVDRYIRMHGNTNFGAGGAFADAAYVWKKYGIVPEEVYSGLNYGSNEHNHSELDAILKSYADAVIENRQKGSPPMQWP